LHLIIDYMKRFFKYSIGFFLLAVIFETLSCSDNQDNTPPPTYVGTWERTWTDTTAGSSQFMKQTLDLKTGNYSSVMFKEFDKAWHPWIEVTGTYSVTENIMKVDILKLGQSTYPDPMTYYNPVDVGFNSILTNDLKTTQKFTALQEAYNNQLTIRLDCDGDSIVGDCVIVFDRIN
jgi:hypothetical protein